MRVPAPAGWVVIAACLLTVALLLLVVVHGLGAVGTVSGVVAAVCAAATLGFQLVDRSKDPAERPNLLAPHLLPTDALIDRADEMEQLLGVISSAGIANCHGQRGAGKSFLLEHLADVVNGHRPPARDHPVSGPVVAALYFDLADAVGFEQISADVCRSAVGSPDGSWSEFVDYVVGAFPKRDVLLILDNVNTPAIWPSLGKAAYRYLASRPNDRLILGSIDPVLFDNLAVKHLEVSGLTEAAIAELVRARGTEPEPEFVAVLHEQYEGLPFYVQLLTPYEPASAQQDRTTVASSILDAQLIPELAATTKRLMAYMAVLGVVSRQVPMSEIERCPIADVQGQVAIAVRHSLLSRTSERRGAIKIHDIVRDAVLRTLHDEVSEAAANLFDRSFQDGAWVDAAFFAMFADPSAIGAKRFDSAFGFAIEAAVDSRDNALISNLLFRAQQSARVLEFLSADPDRYDLFCYGRASQLAASGNYSEAEEVLYGSSIARRRPGDDAKGLRSQLRYLQADLAHLLNRYDEATEMFAELGAFAAAHGQARLEARCVWAQAHVLRHQGRELDRSLALFASAAQLAESCNELFVKVHSVTGACGIRVALDALAVDEERLLMDAEREVAASVSHDGYMLRIWKAQARVAWARGSRDRAWEIIEAAIDKAIAVNDRALHNLRFERADFHRLSGQPDDALVGYLQAQKFAEEEGDRNLLSSCLLGLVLTDVVAGEWAHFKTSGRARAAALRAREVALEADVQMTAQIASQVVSMLDAPSPEASARVRLIVF